MIIGLLGLALLCGDGLAQGGKTTASDALYGRDHIVTIDIKLAPADWTTLRISHRNAELSKIAESPYRYYKADVTIDGREFRSVGVRKKGFFGSVISTRPSLKIRFDKYVKGRDTFGLDQLTLNNNVQDPSRVHQYISYWLFQRAGVEAPRCNFARVTVNGEDLGIYSNLESIRKPFLRRVFGSSKGDLYEGYAGDFVDREGSFKRIVHKGRIDRGRQRLEALRDVLKAEEVAVATIEKLVDVDGFMRFWATEVLIGHWDGYASNRNNYYLYTDAKSGRLHFIPWGADSVFSDPGPFITTTVPRSVKAEGILCQRLWASRSGRARYQREMRRLLSEVWDERVILDEMKKAEELLAPHLPTDSSKFRAALGRARSFVKRRRAAVEPELAKADLEWPVLDDFAADFDNPVTMRITGSFTSRIGSGEPDQKPAGAGTIEVVVGDGKKVTLEEVKIQAALEDRAFIRPGYPLIRMFATHPETKKPWTVSFVIDPIRWQLEKPNLAVDHYGVWAMLHEGTLGAPDSKDRPFGVTGTLKLDHLEKKPGGAVSGSFDVTAPAFD